MAGKFIGKSFFSEAPKAVVPYVVPALEEISPDYAALIRKRLELQIRRSEVITELGELGKTKPSTLLAQEREARIAEMLGDHYDPTLVTLAQHRKKYADLQQELTDIEQALPRMDQRIENERRLASIAVLKIVEPEYRNRVRAMCEGLRDLLPPIAAYHELIEGFERRQIGWTALGPMHPAFLGNPDDRRGEDPFETIKRYLTEAAKLGFIESNFIPQENRR